MNPRNTRVMFTLAMLMWLFLTACNQREKISMGTDTSDYVSPALETVRIGRALNEGMFDLFVSLSAAVVLGGIFWLAGRRLQLRVKRLSLIVAGLMAFILLFGFDMLAASFVTVDAGRVGVLVRQGKAIRTLEPGLHLITPFLEEAVTFSTRDWTFITMSEPIEQGSEDYRTYPLSIITEDGVSASVKFNVQGRLNPAAAIHVFEHFGTLENAIVQLIKSPSLGIVRTSIQGFTAMDLIDNIDAVSEEVEGKLRPIVEEGGITMVFFTFRKPSLGAWEDELNNARVAEQKAVVAEQEIAITQAEARSTVAKAEGDQRVTEINAEAEAAATMAQRRADADADLYEAQQAAEAERLSADAEAYGVRVRAEAEAEGYRKIAPSVTEELILFTMWQNWDGQLPAWMGNDARPLVSLPGPTQ